MGIIQNKSIEDFTLKSFTLTEINRVLIRLGTLVSQSHGIGQNADLHGSQIVNVGNPTRDKDAINKTSLDSGLAPKTEGPDASTDNAIARFDGTTGKVLQNSPATVDDAGSINIPTGETYDVNGTPHTHSLDGLSDVATTSEEQGDLVYRGASGWVNVHHGTSGQVWTTKGHGANPEWTDIVSQADGWISDTDTWTYASATSFTIAGKDVTARFPVGCKLKLTQTSVKYFYVVGSVFSTDTTITVTGGSDYTLASAAITSPCYSYQSCPQGFPQWFNYSETWTGFSSAPSGGICRFMISGRTCYQNVARANGGTSDATTATVSLAVTSTSTANYRAYSFGNYEDAGAWSTSLGGSTITDSDTAASLYAGVLSTDAWTASGEKNWKGLLVWEI